MNGSQAYRRKNRLWKLFCAWQAQVTRAFFPDTGGVSLYLHNWYRCAEKSNPKGAALADWIDMSTWARYRRLEAKLKQRDVEREHLTHTPGNPKGFWPYWCPLCNRKD